MLYLFPVKRQTLKIEAYLYFISSNKMSEVTGYLVKDKTNRIYLAFFTYYWKRKTIELC